MGDRITQTDRHLPTRMPLKDWGILIVLWVLAAGVDQLWLALDHGTPSWDPADHLIGALNYWWTLQPQHWFTGHVWTALWTLSSKYPPLLYVSTAPFLSVFGKGADQAISVNLLYTAILIYSVYGLGRILFRSEVGLWAAGICLLFPQFYGLRTGYYMDYPLTALVAASTLMLTLWSYSQPRIKSSDGGDSSSNGNSDSSSSHRKDQFFNLQTPPSKPHLPNLTFQTSLITLQWLLALSFGVTFGLALLTKQTAIFFLAIPLLWMGCRALLIGMWQRSWSRVRQLFSALAIALVMILPWSQSNWLFQISAVFNSNIRSAKIEGDPGWNTIAGWLYYCQHLPIAISYPLLIVPIVGLIFGGWQCLKSTTSSSSTTPSFPRPFLFLSIFLVSIYAIWSAIANKDSRYIMPWLPLWSIVLAYGLLSFPQKWHWVKWATVGVAVVVMVMNIFPVGGNIGRAIAHTFAPGAYHQPYLRQPWPHDDIIEEIIATQPYQIANVGVLPSTPAINQHNLTLAGNRHNFQVYARRMGKDRDYLERDVRSLSWFISVTPPNLNHHNEKSRKRQKEMLDILKQSGDFKRHRVWELPDGSKLKLFRRQTLPVEVKPLDDAIANVLYDSEQLNAILALVAPSNNSPSQDSSLQDNPLNDQSNPNRSPSTTSSSAVAIQPMRVHLNDITVPQRTPPGQPIPVTYHWSGSWAMLHDGLVFLTWHRLRPNEVMPTASHDSQNAQNSQNTETALALRTAQASQVSQQTTAIAHPVYPSNRPNRQWFHDHRIGLGTLYPQMIQANQAITASSTIAPLKPFTVIEHTAMLPPATLKPGRYTLTATYVNVKTRETYPIDSPPVLVQVRSKATPKAAPEPDWVSQLRQAALSLPQGIKALEQVFDNLGRVNLYDPVQAYTQDGEMILKWRLQHNPEALDDAYGLALAQALQRDAQGAIAALEQAVQLDDQNPYTYAELAFVNLYTGRPWTAQKLLDRAMELDPTIPEIQILDAIAAAMRGNFWQAWQRYHNLST